MPMPMPMTMPAASLALSLALALIGQPPGLPADVFAPATAPSHCQPGPTPMLTGFAIQVDNVPPAILALSLALIGPSPAPDPAPARQGWVESASPWGRIVFEDEPGASPSGYYVGTGPGLVIRHEHDGPDAPGLELREVVGRYVRIEGERATRIIIVGGTNPRDFAMALSAARWMAEARGPAPGPPPIAEKGPARPAMPSSDPDGASLVARLGSPSYATRESASAALIRGGLASLPVLAVAERSGDAEIRARASACLRAIREGE